MNAVEHADAAAEAWREAVRSQRAAPADHADFYALAGSVVVTLQALDGLCDALAPQLAGYDEGRVLRDDQGRDPMLRLAEAGEYLALTRRLLAAAERSGNALWSALSHVAVEVQP